MGTFIRGFKNAFRNPIRTLSVSLILAISIALSIVMLLSMQAVNSKIAAVKSSIGNTITVTPAGSQNFAGGGNPLTMENVDQIKSTPHVVSTVTSLNDRLDTASSTNTNSAANGFAGGEESSFTTNLVSPINPGTLGRRFGGRFAANNPNFTLPITVIGTTDPTSTRVASSNKLTIVSGSTIDGNSSQDIALLGKDLASKNNLSAGSTFTAYNKTITVKGIYDSGSTFSNASIIMPLATLQNLSEQSGAVTNIIVQVDSIGNVDATVSALQSKLGSAADVVSSQDNSNQAIAPLTSIASISLYGLVGATAAGAVIIFLTMLMIVRERRREIGVLKAIGGSNIKIVGQFIVEALTLTITGAIVGVIAGALLSNPILSVLVASNASNGQGQGGGQFGGFRGASRFINNVGGSLNSIHAALGWNILLIGLGAAILIAILGSAIPAYIISKVRPAEVLRAE